MLHEDLENPVPDIALNVVIGENDVFTKVLKEQFRSLFLADSCLLLPATQKSLGMHLARLDKVKVLFLPCKPFLAKEVIKNLGGKEKLTRLNLSGCHLSEESIRDLCQQLHLLKQLIEPNISQNKIGAKGTEYIAESIKAWGKEPQLQELDLTECDIDYLSSNSLLTAIVSCTRLQYLSLSLNCIGFGRDVIGQWKLSPFLEELYLEGSHISRTCCIQLLKSLVSCKNLTWLDISKNPIGGSLQHVDQSSLFPQLQNLHVDEVKLEKEDVLCLASVMKNQGIPLLHALHMKNCDIDVSAGFQLMNALVSCKQLYRLDLSGNRITGLFQSLDSHLYFPRLFEFYVGNTSFTEGDIQWLASAVKNRGLPRLTVLQIGFRNLREIADRMETNIGADYHMKFCKLQEKLCHILAAEPDEMFEAWKVLVDKGKVELSAGDFFIQWRNMEHIVKQERYRRQEK